MKLKKISAMILSLSLGCFSSIAYAGTWEHKHIESNNYSFWKYKNDDGTYAQCRQLKQFKNIDYNYFYMVYLNLF